MPENTLLRAQLFTLAPSTFNRATGTVEAVLSSGAGVQRRDARGAYTERLSVTGMTMSGSRVPLLDSHRRASISDIIGFVDTVRSENGSLVAVLHVTSEPALDGIERGAITGVSIGYTVPADGWQESDNGRIRTATRWTLAEVSLVPIPSDPNAILRSDPMPDDPTPNPSPTPNPAIADRAAINVQIRSLARTAGLSTEFADGLIDRAATIEETRAAAFDELIRRRVHIPATQIGASNDDPGVIRTRMAAALAHRLGVPGELAAEAVQYRGMGLHDMARNMLAARGERVLSMPIDDLLTRAIGTTDLPILLQETGNRTLLAAYQPALSPVFQLARQATATDFRTQSRVRLGEFQKLERVAEHGEITHGGVAETKESYALATYAKMFALTRQAIVNDDLGAFADVSTTQGRAAAETQNDLIVTLLTANAGLGPTMSDGNPLFHSSHGNVAASGSTILGTPGISDATLAMRTQKGVDGVSPINVTPRYLLVAASEEFEARQAVADFYPATSATTNPLAGTLDVLVEPRLTGPRWYVFADKSIMPVLEYAYLAAAPGPQMASRPGWDILGIEFRVYLDFGCGVIDWRGAYTNEGDDGV